jgi:hypothetical protein
MCFILSDQPTARSFLFPSFFKFFFKNQKFGNQKSEIWKSEIEIEKRKTEANGDSFCSGRKNRRLKGRSPWQSGDPNWVGEERATCHRCGSTFVVCCQFFRFFSATWSDFEDVIAAADNKETHLFLLRRIFFSLWEFDCSVGVTLCFFSAPASLRQILVCSISSVTFFPLMSLPQAKELSHNLLRLGNFWEIINLTDRLALVLFDLQVVSHRNQLFNQRLLFWKIKEVLKKADEKSRRPFKSRSWFFVALTIQVLLLERFSLREKVSFFLKFGLFSKELIPEVDGRPSPLSAFLQLIISLPLGKCECRNLALF